MKFIRKLAALVVAFSLALSPFALADQSSLYSPTTGTVSGLNLSNNYNNALNALATCNSGAIAPANTLSAAPVAGQCWLDNSTSRYKLKWFDGTSWLTAAQFDPSTHIWMPVVGGGSGTLASATTTDLGSLAETFQTITGTTTITGFGSSAPAGSVKFLKFASGGLTLTYNATSLIIPGAISKVTSAGDTAIAVSLGSGNWQVLNYTSSAGGSLPEQVLTWVSSPAISFDPIAGPDVSLTLSGASASFGAITNQSSRIGQHGQIRFIQDATGGRTLSIDNGFVMFDGNPVALNPLPSTQTVFTYWIKSSSGAGSVILSPLITSSAPVLLNTLTASNSASLQDTTSFTTNYRYYRIIIENLVPVTNAVDLRFKPQISATYQLCPSAMLESNPSSGTNLMAGSSEILRAVSNIAGGGGSGEVLVVNPAAAGVLKSINATMTGQASGGTTQPTHDNSGIICTTSTAAMTGFQLIESSGNISTGIVKIYAWN